MKEHDAAFEAWASSKQVLPNTVAYEALRMAWQASWTSRGEADARMCEDVARDYQRQHDSRGENIADECATVIRGMK